MQSQYTQVHPSVIVRKLGIYDFITTVCLAAVQQRRTKKQLLLHNCAVKPLFSIILDCDLHNGFWGSLQEAHWDLSLQFCEKHMRADPLKEIILFAQQRKTKTANSDMQGFFSFPEGKMLEMPLILQHGTLISSPQNTAEATSNLSQHNPPEAWNSQPDKVPFSKPRSIKRKSDWKALHQKKVPCY